MPLDCILMVLSKGEVPPYKTRASLFSRYHLIFMKCFICFSRIMYWDSVSKLVAPGGLLVSPSIALFPSLQ